MKTEVNLKEEIAQEANVLIESLSESITAELFSKEALIGLIDELKALGWKPNRKTR